ncbi:hypothetical protein GCM10011496_06710 [Polaromonas eurypsychrophila]|uniref:Outer membrane protein assembly factor BamE n=2 Tax=Polaromonas eurypsychrophila TaxID=1614635 RepID=A0A916S8J7_9BURK|nr:hypothetical protein GCM10011496_06710 [Polaromonas eurypsychrophila]
MINHIATPKPMSAKNRHGIQTALTILACSVLAACGSIKGMTSGLSDSKINPVNWITPYKIEIVQGNFVSKEQVELLKPGMLRAQVREVLGTPLLTSVFHEDRWDYVFTLKRQDVEPQALKLTVFFKNDVLERFEGDAMPSESEFVSRLDSRRKFGKVPVLELTDEQLKAAEKKPAGANVAPATPPAPMAPPTASYPPLESPTR